MGHSENMELSVKERLMLSNQFKILEKLYPEEASYYAEHREALERGYALHYDWMVEFFSPPMTHEQSREVFEILNMYRAITFSNQNLPEDEREDHPLLQFPGFDGNNEGQYLLYTEYLINTLERWQELTYDQDNPDFNSHMEMLPAYRRMVTQWDQLGRPERLGAEGILKILEAGRSC